MRKIIILIYGCITGLTILLLSIVIKYLKSKALNKKFVRDQILIDLTSLIMSFVSLLSSIIAIREIVGPFQNVAVVDSIFMVLQCFFDVILVSIVSLQIVQILNIFQCPAVNDWQEESQVIYVASKTSNINPKDYILTLPSRDRETERRRDRETEGQRDRETERQRVRETERQRHIIKQKTNRYRPYFPAD
jgi:hypothetical protein